MVRGMYVCCFITGIYSVPSCSILLYFLHCIFTFILNLDLCWNVALTLYVCLTCLIECFYIFLLLRPELWYIRDMTWVCLKQNFKRMSKTEDIVALTFFASAFLRGGRAVLKMFFYMRINPIFFIT